MAEHSHRLCVVGAPFRYASEGRDLVLLPRLLGDLHQAGPGRPMIRVAPETFAVRRARFLEMADELQRGGIVVPVSRRIPRSRCARVKLRRTRMQADSRHHHADRIQRVGILSG